MVSSNAVKGFAVSHLVRLVAGRLLGARWLLGNSRLLGGWKSEFLADPNNGVLCWEIVQASEFGEADPILSGNTPESFAIRHGVRT